MNPNPNDPKDELANFDPQAQQRQYELQEEQAAAERATKRKKIGLIALIGLVLALLVIWGRSCQRETALQGMKPIEPGSSLVNLAGLEVATVGTVDGPWLLLDAVTPRRIVMTDLTGRKEPFDLIGLDPSGYPIQDVATAELIQRYQGMEAFKKEAIKALCGSDRLYLIRMTDPAPGRPSMIYLFNPLAAESVQPNQAPVGQAELVNAQLLRQGKANLALLERPQPFYEKMAQCQLAAILEAERGRVTAADSIWKRYSMPMPMSEESEAIKQEITRFVK